MHAIALAAGLLACVIAAEGATAAEKKSFKRKHHGAIAIDRQSDSWGFGVDFQTSREARLEALKQCSRKTCEVVMRIEGECGAVARTRAAANRKFSSSRGATKDEAETRALRQCGKDCEPVPWACNTR